MTVLTCLGVEEKKGGRLQLTYVETFERYLPVAMKQITSSLYKFVMDWEPADFIINIPPPTNEDDGSGQDSVTVSEEVFRKKYNACQPVYVPSFKKFYLAIKADWFSKYVGSELCLVRDCYVAKLVQSETGSYSFADATQ